MCAIDRIGNGRGDACGKLRHRGPARDKMEQFYISTKAICRGSVQLTSLKKKERGEKSIFSIVWFRMKTIILDGIYMHTGRESHVDFDGVG